MKFCPRCGSILRPKLVHEKKVLACSCGYADEGSSNITFDRTNLEHKNIEELLDSHVTAAHQP